MFRLVMLLSTLFLTVIPVSRAVQHNVVVGGPGVLAFDPEFVVRSPKLYPLQGGEITQLV
jgi:hypothetical protein